MLGKKIPSHSTPAPIVLAMCERWNNRSRSFQVNLLTEKRLQQIIRGVDVQWL
jgi:hypothetical protein